jgi:hypothetical protein
MKEQHTTKKGPGRRHKEGTHRGSLRKKEDLPREFSGAKLARKAVLSKITLRAA